VPSLLEQLGGRDAVEVLVVGVWERIGVVPRLAGFFVDVSRPQYEQRLADYLCLLLGDRLPAWRGRDLRGVHADLAIRDDDFNAFLDCVTATLDAAGVSRPLMRRVRDRLETVRGVVVGAAAR
jgi:truncated hemoglobin YjbI